MELRGARVLVTGASRGIGEAIAREVAERGATVVGVARDAAALDDLVGDIGGVAFPADLTEPGVVRGLVARVEAEVGPIDVLVNNAGIDVTGPFDEMDEATIERLYRLNLITPVQLCRQALPLMEARGRGHLVNVSSFAGSAGFGGMTTYSSSKAGLTRFTRVLALENRRGAVGTTVVQLGPVPSDMLDHVFDFVPTRAAFERFYRLRLLVDVPRRKVATRVADAVEKDRPFVRLPRRGVIFPMADNFSQWFVARVLTGMPQR